MGSKRKSQSIERLHHMSCSKCGRWWTIGDAPQSKKKWFCPWCGAMNSYGKASKKI